MKTQFDKIQNSSFLITGGAGFIGSHIVEYLINHRAKNVRVLDNLATGFYQNIAQFEGMPNFEFIKGDIRSLEDCKLACKGINYLSHQAALGSVPRSIEDPITTNEVNVGGFLNIMIAAKEANINQMVYAASSSTYGDSTSLPKVEDKIGKPLSPYAITKYVNELYAEVFNSIYGFNSIGLRYFNVFGPRQSASGQYAAVVPLLISSIKSGNSPFINGDGNQSRDFTYVQNAVQANIKALLTEDKKALNQIFNIAVGESTSINRLLEIINEIASKEIKPIYRANRLGDVKVSLADISKAKKLLGYIPEVKVREGIEITFNNS